MAGLLPTDAASPGPQEARATFGDFADLSRDSLTYAIGAVVGKAVGLIMLPILTRLLTPSDYGRVEVLSTLGTVAISALLLGLDTAALRIYFDIRESARRTRLLATWSVLAGVIVIPAALGLVLLSENVSQLLFESGAYASAVEAVGLVIFFGTYHHISLTVLRLLRRPRAFAGLSAGTLVLNGGIVIWLVLTIENPVTAVILGFAVSVLLMGAVGLFLVRRHLASLPDRSDARALFRLGLPLAPGLIALWGAEFVNRAVLLDAAGPAEVANLAVSIRIASVAALVVGGFQLAWQPHAFARGLSAQSLERLAMDARRILISVAAMATALALVAPEVIRLAAGQRYAEAIPVVGISLVGVIASAVFLIASMPNSLARRMGDVGIAMMAGVVVSVVGNAFLASTFGAAGTAAAIAVGPIAASAVVVVRASSHLAVPIQWAQIAPVVITLVGSTLLVTVLPSGQTVLARLVIGSVCAAVLLSEGTLADVVRHVTRGAVSNSKTE